MSTIGSAGGAQPHLDGCILGGKTWWMMHFFSWRNKDTNGPYVGPMYVGACEEGASTSLTVQAAHSRNCVK